jgi:hypothetical protein
LVELGRHDGHEHDRIETSLKGIVERAIYRARRQAIGIRLDIDLDPGPPGIARRRHPQCAGRRHQVLPARRRDRRHPELGGLLDVVA